MTTQEKIQNSPLLKQVLKDSCGGCLYDVRNYNKYDGTEKDELLALWNSLTAGEQDVMGGIIKGAMSFLKGD